MSGRRAMQRRQGDPGFLSHELSLERVAFGILVGVVVIYAGLIVFLLVRG